MKYLISLFVLMAASNSLAATYYIRTDGGNASECTGLVDAAYPGSGTDQDCAWNHPFEALGVNAAASYPQRIAGGDTVIIKSGSYKMGREPGVYDQNGCSSGWPWDCYPASIPAGTDTSHTRILGEGWDTGCTNPPELYGTEMTKRLLQIVDSAYVDIECLELTDHSDCTTNANVPDVEQCPEDPPFGDIAQEGILAYNVNQMTWKNLNVHGIKGAGTHTAEITDWLVEDCRFYGNANGALNLQVDTDAALNQFYNTLTLRNTEFSWSGCIEAYPEVGNIKYKSCVGGNMGGFGDAIAFQRQDNGVYIEVDNCRFVGNVEDGFDNLYSRTDSTVVSYVHDSYFAHNAGNDIKIGGSGIVENNYSVGDCGFFDEAGVDFAQNRDTGTSADDNVTPCRGNATLSITLQYNNASVSVINNSFSGQADSMISCSSSAAGSTDCDGTERVYFADNIFRGGSHFQGVKVVDAYYIYNTCPEFEYTAKNNSFYNNKDGTNDCVDSIDSSCEDPQYDVFDPVNHIFDFKIPSSSPAIGIGLPVGTEIGYNLAITNTPGIDYFQNTRTSATPDAGMFEEGAGAIACEKDYWSCADQVACESTGWIWKDGSCGSIPVIVQDTPPVTGGGQLQPGTGRLQPGTGSITIQ